MESRKVPGIKEGGREGGRGLLYLDDRAVITSVEVGGGGEEATHVLLHQKDPESVVLGCGLPDRLEKGEGRKGGREGGLGDAHAWRRKLKCGHYHLYPTVPPFPSLPPSSPVELREHNHGLGVEHEVLGGPVGDGIQVGPRGVVAWGEGGREGGSEEGKKEMKNAE
jgi:hypothetical protein